MKCLKPRLATTTSANQPGWKPDSQRGNRHERGYDYEWEKRRERIKQRAKGLCEPHLANGLVHQGNECDHVISKAEGKVLGWTPEQIEADGNLQWCCTEYHLEKTAREDSKHHSSERTPTRGGGSTS